MRLAFPADSQGDHAATGSFADHPPQLGCALNSGPVQGQDDIVFFETGFAGRGVLIDHGDFRAVLFLELQLSQPLRRNVGNVHSEV